MEIGFDMPVHIVKADDRATDLLGRIAVERGPVVYCTTLPNDDKEDIRSLSISSNDRFDVQKEKKAGAVILTDADRNLEFIPYYRHAQEGPTQMSVWINAIP